MTPIIAMDVIMMPPATMPPMTLLEMGCGDVATVVV